MQHFVEILWPLCVGEVGQCWQSDVTVVQETTRQVLNIRGTPPHTPPLELTSAVMLLALLCSTWVVLLFLQVLVSSKRWRWSWACRRRLMLRWRSVKCSSATRQRPTMRRWTWPDFYVFPTGLCRWKNYVFGLSLHCVCSFIISQVRGQRSSTEVSPNPTKWSGQ